MPKLSVIIPCYYNEDNLPVTLPELDKTLQQLPADTTYEYVLVDDGSQDSTWEKIADWQQQHPNKVVAVKLSGNFGAFNAVLAGMRYATGDAMAIIAADLQDPPELIPQMYAHWQKGLKLVLANRTDREESWGQKLFSNTFHKLMKRYAIPHIPTGGFDLCLFDKQLAQEVVNMDERNSHSLYLLVWMKYPYVTIPYVRRKREIGKSRWTMRKKVKLLIDSFVSFSFAPIRFISLMGFSLGILAIAYGLFVLIARLSGGIPIEGWSTLMIVVLVVSAFQMFALGILGEYIWRSLDAARRRPNYFVDTLLKETPKEAHPPHHPLS